MAHKEVDQDMGKGAWKPKITRLPETPDCKDSWDIVIEIQC
jgi:hypothetical protein